MVENLLWGRLAHIDNRQSVAVAGLHLLSPHEVEVGSSRLPGQLRCRCRLHGCPPCGALGPDSVDVPATESTARGAGRGWVGEVVPKAVVAGGSGAGGGHQRELGRTW